MYYNKKISTVYSPSPDPYVSLIFPFLSLTVPFPSVSHPCLLFFHPCFLTGRRQPRGWDMTKTLHTLALVLVTLYLSLPSTGTAQRGSPGCTSVIRPSWPRTSVKSFHCHAHPQTRLGPHFFYLFHCRLYLLPVTSMPVLTSVYPPLALLPS